MNVNFLTWLIILWLCKNMSLCFRKYTLKHFVMLRHCVYKLSNYTYVCTCVREEIW